ncbi:MAG: UDP-N-acetylmuramoyl-L-alanine--D-glutamate ligase [Flavobacteriales bacterium]|nr:UDP-N-acetylmuramoyl-L-alanine--D-glutamate ligase [Flavobacteriales bacterium]
MKKLIVLGAGESGVGGALLGRKHGFDVFVSDFGSVSDKYRRILTEASIAFEENTHTFSRILDADLVVKSPGIAKTVPVVKAILEEGIELVSEIEFAARYTQAKIIGITGTNGKTTTTLLAYHILKNAGLHVGLAGNVGQSFAAQVANNDFDHYVLEISSFQLDDISSFRPDVSVILNITADHLDRYNNDIYTYAEAKFRIAEHQTEDDFFLYNADDPIIANLMNRRRIKAQKKGFSLHPPAEGDIEAFLDHEKFVINLNTDPLTMSIHDLALSGKHNAYNSLAAGMAAKLLGVRKEIIRESLSDFQEVEHRLEPVLQVHGVTYINDSKATNVNSTWYALESMSTPVVWIVGGVDKGNDYEQLKSLVSEKVSAIVCLGADNAKIKAAFGDLVEHLVEAGSMEEAVKAAYNVAQKGHSVLLSPACASFDLFENYEDRGRQFKEEVRQL